MAQTVAWGSGASVTWPTGIGFMANSSRVNVSQSIAEAVGFGLAWALVQGMVKRYTAAMSGVLTYGTTSDQPALTMTKAGVAVTITFSSGCTFSDTMVQSDNTMGSGAEVAGDASYAFRGPVSSAGPILTWAVS